MNQNMHDHLDVQEGGRKAKPAFLNVDCPQHSCVWNEDISPQHCQVRLDPPWQLE